MIHICFRFDDPSLTSDHVVERLLIAELEQRGLCATFAVIPFSEGPNGRRSLDRSTAAHLIEAQRKGVIEIAQHGHTHTLSPHHIAGQPSEFYGRPLDEQEALIREGHQHLEKIFSASVEGFVPPWNSGDASTLNALRNLGFQYTSSATTAFPGYRGPICRLPRTCHLNTANQALNEARLFKRLSPVVVVVMHHYDFNTENSEGFEKLRALLDRIAADPLLRVVTLKQAATHSSPKQCIAAVEHILNKEKAHWRIQQLYPQLCLVQRPLWKILFCRILDSWRRHIDNPTLQTGSPADPL